MCCEHFVSKIYLCERQLTTKANVIVVKINNLKIVNRIVITTKTR